MSATLTHTQYVNENNIIRCKYWQKCTKTLGDISFTKCLLYWLMSTFKEA